MQTANERSFLFAKSSVSDVPGQPQIQDRKYELKCVHCNKSAGA